MARDADVPALAGQDVRLTILHTSDIHSRLLPYSFEPSFTDEQLGLASGRGPYGGIDRIATILKRERARAHRVVHLDSGDSFQGAVVFNEFDGEAEFRLLSEIGLDAAVVANHEFDKGATNLAHQGHTWAGFKLLAANYDFDDADLLWGSPLENLVQPSAIFDLDGFRIGVIGLANVSSLTSIYDETNSLKVEVLEPEDVIPREAAILRSQGAEIIVAVSHMGVNEDIALARALDDVDVFMSGHNHVALDPPLVVTHEATGKRIPIVASGAFAKFVGRLDLVVRDGEVLSHDFELFPVDAGVPSDARTVDILEEYAEQLALNYKLDQVIGYAEQQLTRYGTSGGDSMLGNFTAEAMRFYPGVGTEIALTNTLGIRADIPPGNITLDAIYNATPFDNLVTTMFLSGREVQELLDYVAFRSSERGCSSQAQVAGLTFDMNCLKQVAENIVVNGSPLDPDGVYELATNDYIAYGGSGFEVLERNTTKVVSEISIRDVVIDAIIQYQTLPQPGIAEEDGRINPVF